MTRRTGARRLVISAATTGLIAGAALTTAQAASASGADAASAPAKAAPAYISLLFGRANWQVAGGRDCSITFPGARTLEQNAQDMKARGVTGTAMVVVGRTVDTGHSCFGGYTLQSSWEDLANLRSKYGWQVTSQGMYYKNMTLMTTDAQRYAESAATLPIFRDHGFTRAWGSFAFANNKMDLPAQKLVSKYFAFLRKYGDGVTRKAKATTFPYIMTTLSINGGQCNNVNLKCYDFPVANDRRATDLNRLKTLMNPAPDTWSVVQAYRFVEGKQGAMPTQPTPQVFSWDCTSSDWRNRWTSQPEIYCRNSFLEAIDGRSKTAVNADAVDVAKAWGRTPG